MGGGIRWVQGFGVFGHWQSQNHWLSRLFLALCEAKSSVTGTLNGFGRGLSDFTKWACLFFSVYEACKQTLVQNPQKTPVGVVEKTPPPQFITPSSFLLLLLCFVQPLPPFSSILVYLVCIFIPQVIYLFYNFHCDFFWACWSVYDLYIQQIEPIFFFFSNFFVVPFASCFIYSICLMSVFCGLSMD